MYPRQSLAALLALTAALWLGSISSGRADPPDRATYAAQCAAENGPIPKFNCLDGQLLDITVKDKPQSKPVDVCDKPVQLGLGGGSQCVPFSRFLSLDTGNPNVTTIVICRKYFPSTGPTDPRFDDIAMIQHNKATGKTCFFQSKLEANLDGSKVPSPSDTSPQGDAYWLPTTAPPPANSVANIKCSSCHAADPFIWSPYVAQRADLSRWDPFGKYDSNFANLFGGPAKVFKPTGNACVSCHRFGHGPASDTACNYFPHHYVGHKVDATAPDEFWMPPNFGSDAPSWHASFDTALAQIDRCCANPDLAECLSVIATGEQPPRIGAVWQYSYLDEPDNLPSITPIYYYLLR